jgi:hypothetical protein
MTHEKSRWIVDPLTLASQGNRTPFPASLFNLITLITYLYWLVREIRRRNWLSLWGERKDMRQTRMLRYYAGRWLQIHTCLSYECSIMLCINNLFSFLLFVCLACPWACLYLRTIAITTFPAWVLAYQHYPYVTYTMVRYLYNAIHY